MVNAFPEYEFINHNNYFNGEDVGRGGYVWAKPGIYRNVWCFDVSGQHPSSIINMNYFGKYTPRYKELVDARIFIKHGDYDSVKRMFDGKLAKYLNDPSEAKKLSTALKIVVNGCYGLTAADFPNPMKDPRNINNIVALRGALFMKTLYERLTEKGIEVIHIKTDSIKVVNPSKAIYDFIIDFGKEYGYNFEIEHKFDKICLVNNAVYIAKLAADDPEDPGKWTATGAQFAQSYVFKTLFSKEPITFDDLCEVKEVKGSIYLDLNEDLPNVIQYEEEKDIRRKLSEGKKAKKSMFPDISDESLEAKIQEGHNYQFVGKVGLFVPIQLGHGGGLLVKLNDLTGKYDYVTGASGYRWLEAETVMSTAKEKFIDLNYHRKLVDSALDEISKYGDPEEFIADDIIPNVPPFCNHEDCATCEGLEECQSMAASYATV